jgi:hypothetical protein
MKKRLITITIGATLAMLSSSCSKQLDDTNVEPKEVTSAALRFTFRTDINTGANFGTMKVQIVNAAIGAFNAKYPSGRTPSGRGTAVDFAATALAIAMQETWDLTSNTSDISNCSQPRNSRTGDTEYPWRDSKCLDNVRYPGPPKDNDASNFGHYKMNWFMIRQNAAFTAGNTPDNLDNNDFGNYNDPNSWGRRINANISWSTRMLLEYYDRPGWNRPTAGERRNFWSGHRWGQTGWDGGAPIADIQGYHDAIQTVKRRIIAENIQVFKGNNTRYAHNIVNI